MGLISLFTNQIFSAVYDVITNVTYFYSESSFGIYIKVELKKSKSYFPP